MAKYQAEENIENIAGVKMAIGMKSKEAHRQCRQSSENIASWRISWRNQHVAISGVSGESAGVAAMAWQRHGGMKIWRLKMAAAKISASQ